MKNKEAATRAQTLSIQVGDSVLGLVIQCWRFFSMSVGHSAVGLVIQHKISAGHSAAGFVIQYYRWSFRNAATPPCNGYYSMLPLLYLCPVLDSTFLLLIFFTFNIFYF